jgi:hypothetical protein
MHRGQVDRVPQGVEGPPEVPMVGDPGLGVDAERAAERGMAAEFGQAGLVRGMPQPGRQDGDAPEDGDRVIVAAPAPRRAVRSPWRRAATGMASRQRRIVPKEGRSSRLAQSKKDGAARTLIPPD